MELSLYPESHLYALLSVWYPPSHQKKIMKLYFTSWISWLSLARNYQARYMEDISAHSAGNTACLRNQRMIMWLPWFRKSLIYLCYNSLYYGSFWYRDRVDQSYARIGPDFLSLLSTSARAGDFFFFQSSSEADVEFGLWLDKSTIELAHLDHRNKTRALWREPPTLEVGSLVLPKHNPSDDNECQLVEYIQSSQSG